MQEGGQPSRILPFSWAGKCFFEKRFGSARPPKFSPDLLVHNYEVTKSVLGRGLGGEWSGETIQ